jgi:hypothetical protein
MTFPNDTGSYQCTGCGGTFVGAHACLGPDPARPIRVRAKPYQPLNPNVRLGPIPHLLTEDDVRRIVREMLGKEY